MSLSYRGRTVHARPRASRVPSVQLTFIPQGSPPPLPPQREQARWLPFLPPLLPPLPLLLLQRGFILVAPPPTPVCACKASLREHTGAGCGQWELRHDPQTCVLQLLQPIHAGRPCRCLSSFSPVSGAETNILVHLLLFHRF